MDDLWKGMDKFADNCAKCGREGLKRNMPTLLARQSTYSPVRTLCHLCPTCFVELLDELEVSMPD